MPKGESEWDPSQPLEDKEAEEEAQRRSQASARVEYLKQKALENAKKPSKKGFFD
jgi:hypothetical protein